MCYQIESLHRTNCTKDAVMADFEGETQEEGKESEPNEEEVADEYDTSGEAGEVGDDSSREETRIERGKDAPPTLLERGSHSATTCK